jgi:uncharacterized protein (DUF885 family)
MTAVTPPDPVGLALAATDAAWDEVRRSPHIAQNLGVPLDRLPEVTEAAAVEQAARARSVLDSIDAIDLSELPHELALTVEVARAQMTLRVRAGDWYWLVFDPLGVGFYSMFAPTAYGGGWLLSKLGSVFTTHRFEHAGDLDRYLGLVEDLGRLVRQLDARTRGQAERGIHLPRVQLEQAIRLVSGLRAGARGVLVPSAERLPDPAQREQVASRVEGVVLPPYDEWLAWLSHPDQAAAAGEAVGISQFPGGAEAYVELVRLHTTLDLHPDEVHQRGLKRIAEIRTEMQAVLDEVGATCPPQEYLELLAADPAWRAHGADELCAFFQRYVDRLRPHVDSAFRFTPAADYGVAPLPEALASSMTFGFYDAPSDSEPTGRYLFNTDNLSQRALPDVASLTYHELVPGHHFHMASQQENEGLHALRRHSLLNAFNEGWAEYAAHLAGELGMYERPEERFGRLVMEAFLTTRLVVDTGMNALGWSLEQARDYMRENAFVSEAEILTESVRYSCDLPGQALAYKIGDFFLRDLREHMRSALGDRFDLRDFHDAVLRPGALPLRLVESNVARAIKLQDG